MNPFPPTGPALPGDAAAELPSAVQAGGAQTDDREPVDLFDDLPTVSEAAMRRLLDRLTVDAASHGVLDVAYRTVDSPVGPLLLATTERGLARIAFASEDHDRVLADLAARISPRILMAPRRLDEAARELDDYFAGERHVFDLRVDLQLARGFRREVLVHLIEVEYGATASYSALAERSGRPRAVRAAASACATNPVPIVVPCHRVIRADGATGNYRGGPAAKTLLLHLESA